MNDFEGDSYKIAGLSVYRDFNKLVYSRKTYDVLAFLGDVGGIVKCILMIGDVFISPFTTFLVAVFMMPHLFYYKDWRNLDFSKFENLLETFENG